MIRLQKLLLPFTVDIKGWLEYKFIEFTTVNILCLNKVTKNL